MNLFLVTKSEFADIAGVKGRTVSGLIKPGHALAAVLVGDKIDLKHPDTAAYLEKRQGLKPGESSRTRSTGNNAHTKARVQGTDPPAPKAKAAQGTPASYDVKDYEHMTVREIVLQFGHIDAFKRFVESAKQIADYKLKEIKIDETRGQLIERDLVKKTLFSVIDVAFSRLVSDVPVSITEELIAVIEAGGEDVKADVQRIVRDANSQALKNIKHTITKAKVLNGSARNPRRSVTSETDEQPEA